MYLMKLWRYNQDKITDYRGQVMKTQMSRKVELRGSRAVGVE